MALYSYSIAKPLILLCILKAIYSTLILYTKKSL